MAYSISDFTTDLTAIIHGTQLNQVENIYGIINRTGRKLLADCDPIETARVAQLDNAIYDQVYDYTPPTDLKGDRVIDIRPQVNRKLRDRFFQTYQETFDLDKAALFQTFNVARPEFTIQWNTNVKSIRIAKDLIAGLLLNPANTISDTGTWAATTDAENLTVDNLNYIAGGGSLRFDLSGAGTTGYLENTGMTPVDISRDENIGAIFLWVYIPASSVVTNFNLRWGSGAADYWTQTVTSAQNSVAFQTGWNLLRFNWDTATSVGSPDATAVDYLRFTITYDGDPAFAYRLNNIMSKLGSIYEMVYYSKYMFRSAAGVFKEKADAEDDEINLDVDSYNLFINLGAYYAIQQIEGSDSVFDATFFLAQYQEDLMRYKAKNKSQIIKPQEQYYKMPSGRRGWYVRQGY